MSNVAATELRTNRILSAAIKNQWLRKTVDDRMAGKSQKQRCRRPSIGIDHHECGAIVQQSVLQCNRHLSAGLVPSPHSAAPAIPHHPKLFHNKRQRDHFLNGMFHGFDFDASMLRIASMNLMLHGVEIQTQRRSSTRFPGQRRQSRPVHRDPGQSAIQELAELGRGGQGLVADRQDEEDGTAVPGPVPATTKARRPRVPASCRTACCSVRPGRIRPLRKMFVDDQKRTA